MNSIQVDSIGSLLVEKNEALARRFRSLFTLKNIGTNDCIDYINQALKDEPSVLLKHELCYCMGQISNPYSIGYLINVLNDLKEDAIVRHESGEALANLASLVDDQMRCQITNALKKHQNDNDTLVAQTCELALKKIKWDLSASEDEKSKAYSTNFTTYDPAPALAYYSGINELESILMDPKSSLFNKYRALFQLRNIGNDQCVHLLGKVLLHYQLDLKMSLMNHEIGYIFGQLANPLSVKYLKKIADCSKCHEVVRHEAIEALGSIGTDESIAILKNHLNDESQIVKESCQVGLDMIDYYTSSQFQFL